MKAKYSTRKDKGKNSSNFTNSNGKQKELHSSEGTEEADFVFPILKTIDKARHLHCYSNGMSVKYWFKFYFDSF